MRLIGFLAPDGTYTQCPSYAHMETARMVCKESYDKIFHSGIDAENFLLEQGYVGFYARGASKHFFEKDTGKLMLLTDEQRDFIINNLINVNNFDQKLDVEQILEYDHDYREDSILSHCEEKFLK